MSEAAVDKAMRAKLFLNDTEESLERGFKEFEEAVRLNDQVRIRDAAEKLWNATINATNALILSLLDTVSASHWRGGSSSRNFRMRILRLRSSGSGIGMLQGKDTYTK